MNEQITNHPEFANGYDNGRALVEANDVADWFPAYERACANPARDSDPYAAGWFSALNNAALLARLSGKAPR